MKKLFFSNFGLFAVAFLVSIFFLPFLITARIPIPADSLIGLYHPWRDNSYNGFLPQKFPVKNPLITDPILQTYPWRFETIKFIKSGQIPLWNPYSFSGQPLMANTQGATFSFFNILFFFLPFSASWAIIIICSSVFSALFMFLFLRELSLSKVSSFFGAILLPFSGFFVAWLTWGTVIVVAMFLPLILLSIKKLFKNITPFYFLILVFSFSQIIFSGHIQTALYVILASTLLLITLFLHERKPKESAVILIAMFFGLLVSAVQLLPSLVFANASSRALDQGFFQGRADWFLPMQNLIQLIAPDFFGNPATYNYWGVWNYAEFVSFIGIIPLIFAFIGITKVRKYPFFLIVLFVSLLLAIENPVAKIPYIYHFSLFSSMQPSRAIFLLCFAMVALSAIGFEHFITEKKSPKPIIASLIVFLSICTLLFLSLFFKNYFPEVENLNPQHIALRNLLLPAILSTIALCLMLLSVRKSSKKVLIAAFLLISTFELFRFAYKFTPFSKTNLIYPQTKIASYLEQSKNQPFRIIATDRRIFTPNTSVPYEIESVAGYDPLYLKDYAKLVSSWNSNEVTEAGSFNRIITPANLNSQVLNILGVKYILSFDELNNPGFQKEIDEGITKLYLNNNAQPRAYFVNSVEKVQDRNQELAFLLNTKDYRKVFSSDFSYHALNLRATVKSVEAHSQTLKISAETSQTAPLFISNIFDPNWQIYIDKKRNFIKRVDFIFQLVLVPVGSHDLELVYRPKSFYNGLYISFIAALLTLLASLLIWKKKYL